MTITRDGRAGTPVVGGPSATSVINMGTLTTGRLITVALAVLASDGAHTYNAASLAKTAGTATISAVSLDVQAGGNNGDDGFTYAVLWSFLVTSGGTCTVTITHQNSNSYPSADYESWDASGGWDASRFEDSSGAHSSTNGLSAFASGDATSAAGAAFIGVLAANNGASMTFTPQNSFTQISTESGSGGAFESLSFTSRIVTTGTTTEGSWTFTTMDGASYNAVAAVVGVYKEVASSGATVTPGAGALTLAGLAPTITVSANRIAQPGVGALTFAGLAPSVLVNRIAQPGAGALVLAGLQPTVAVSNNHVATPGAGALVLAGLQPAIAVSDNATTAPDAGTLTLAGLAPSLVVNHLLQPGAGALVLEGLAPTVVLGTVAQPGAGALTLAGLAPSVLLGFTAAPGADALVLEGLAPTVVATDHHVVEPGAGALVLAGLQPAAVTGGNVVAQPEQAVLVLDGLQPTITTTSNRTVEPGAGALVLEGLAPTVSVTASIVVNPLTGALIFTGLAPTVAVSDHHVVEPGAGTLTLAGLTPEIPVPSPVVEPGAGVLALEGLAPTVVTTGTSDVATDPKLIARRPNVRVDFGTRKKTPAPTPAPAQITNMPGHPPVPRPLAGGLLAALADSPLPVVPTAKPTPAPTAAPAPAPTAAPTAAPAPRVPTPPIAPAPIAAVYAPMPAAPAPIAAVYAPMPAGITPEQMAALLQRMDALSEGVSSRLVEVNKALQGDIERVTQLLEAERDARLARELRERNEARAKEITARLLDSAP